MYLLYLICLNGLHVSHRRKVILYLEYCSCEYSTLRLRLLTHYRPLLEASPEPFREWNQVVELSYISLPTGSIA